MEQQLIETLLKGLASGGGGGVGVLVLYFIWNKRRGLSDNPNDTEIRRQEEAITECNTNSRISAQRIQRLERDVVEIQRSVNHSEAKLNQLLGKMNDLL